MNEKLEREKEYLARKHELLRQQDEDAASIQSSRSGRSQASSRQKVEAWFNQQLMSVDSSDNASNQRQKLSGQTAGPNVGSIPRTTDSISIGDSPGVEDDVNPPNAAKQSKVQSLPLVNIQPYVKILDEANPMTSETALTNTGYPPRIIPKLMGNPLPYTAWQRETSEMRKQHLREHQCPEREAELRQSEQREQELIHLLKRSEEQREQDRQRLQEIEEILKKQHDVEAQHQKENYVRRRRELELVNRLKLFEQEYAQENAKRDEEKQKYLAKEQQLIEQLENLRLSCEQYPAAEQHPAAEQNSVAERCSAAEQRPAADQALMRNITQRRPSVHRRKVLGTSQE
nr:GRB10-interacting GYF protein 2-like [Aedes albopictus]